MQTPQRKPGKYTGQKPDPCMTQSKYNELAAKLDRLINVSRPPAIKEVKRLALDGDFSENAAYSMAKGRLRYINRRIDEIEDLLKRAEIIEGSGNKDRVTLGSSVTLKSGGKEKTYLILGSTETDPTRNIISHNSPLGAALMNKKIGDSVKLPQKQIVYKIIKIE